MRQPRLDAKAILKLAAKSKMPGSAGHFFAAPNAYRL